MVLSAEYIKKKLEQEMVLSQAFGRDLVRGFSCHKPSFLITEPIHDRHGNKNQDH